MTTDIIDRLFLELSQVTTATTGKELKLQAALVRAGAQALSLGQQIEQCGASKPLTAASVMASKLRSDIEAALS